MSDIEKKEFQNTIRGYLQSGRLTDESFGDLALLYSSLNDPSLGGESLSTLKSTKKSVKVGL